MKKEIKSRSFLSIGTFLFLIILSISGVALHKMNHQESYSFMFIFYKTLHTISAMVFLIFSTLHIWKNWKAITSYMKGATKMSVSKEMWIIILLTIFILIISIVRSIGVANEYGISF